MKQFRAMNKLKKVALKVIDCLYCGIYSSKILGFKEQIILISFIITRLLLRTYQMKRLWALKKCLDLLIQITVGQLLLKS